MEIPKTIKIGNYIYRVKKQRWIRPGAAEKEIWGNDITTDAQCDLQKKTIKLRKGCSLLKCFIHEILHIVLFESGASTSFSFKEEEEFVQKLTPLLYQVIKQIK